MTIAAKEFLNTELMHIERELEALEIGELAPQMHALLYAEFQRRRVLVRQVLASAQTNSAARDAVLQKAQDTHMLLDELEQHRRPDVQDPLRQNLQIDLEYLEGLHQRLSAALESARLVYALDGVERL